MTKFSKKLTVITLFYNRSEVVEQTINSLLKQEFQDFDIIAVDDGSTDSTLYELNKINADNFYVVTHENLGFTSSLISILGEVKSDYIAIHGSGDTCSRDKLSKQIEILEQNANVGFCGTTSENLSPLTREVIDIQSYNKLSLTAIDFQSAPPFTHGSVMFRRSIYDLVGGYDSRFTFSQDWDLWLRMLRESKGYMILEPLYQRYILPDGASFNPIKAEKQLIFKHLALLFDKRAGADRNELLAGDVISKNRVLFHNELKKDLVNRLFKLILLGHTEHYVVLKDYVYGTYGVPSSFLAEKMLLILEVMGRCNISLRGIGKVARYTLERVRRRVS